jgi:hypothetical protein
MHSTSEVKRPKGRKFRDVRSVMPSLLEEKKGVGPLN